METDSLNSLAFARSLHLTLVASLAILGGLFVMLSMLHYKTKPMLYWIFPACAIIFIGDFIALGAEYALPMLAKSSWFPTLSVLYVQYGFPVLLFLHVPKVIGGMLAVHTLLIRRYEGARWLNFIVPFWKVLIWAVISFATIWRGMDYFLTGD